MIMFITDPRTGMMTRPCSSLLNHSLFRFWQLDYYAAGDFRYGNPMEAGTAAMEVSHSGYDWCHQHNRTV